MLTDVGTESFLLGSLHVFGRVDTNILALAKDILFRLSSRSRKDSAGGQLSAQEFAAQAQREITVKIGFIVNEINTESATYTTSRLAMAAVNRGHEAWLIGSGDLAFDPDDSVRARARTVSRKGNYKSTKTFFEELRGPKGRAERIAVDDLDVLMLRSDPAADQGRRSWAQMAGINFGRAAMRRGVIVLNDPDRLAQAMNKMYFQLFPEEVRPKT